MLSAGRAMALSSTGVPDRSRPTQAAPTATLKGGRIAADGSAPGGIAEASSSLKKSARLWWLPRKTNRPDPQAPAMPTTPVSVPTKS